MFFLTKLKSIARRIADMIEVNSSESVFEDPKFPYSSMIPENDDTLDNAVNNTENTSESIVDTIFKIQQTLKIYKVVRHLFLDYQRRWHSYEMKSMTVFQHH